MERAVLDLHLLVLAAVPRSAPLARNDQGPGPGDELDVVGVDPRQLDDDRERRRVVLAEEIDVRPVAAPRAAREREDLPEVAEELLDLVGSGLEVASLLHPG